MLDFLGIGAQKAGTTWLYHALSRHPQVWFPAGKEVHFWDQKRERGVEWWLGLFAEPRPGVRQGEITPAYALLEVPEIREIRRVAPDLRVLYVLRNPLERAWSAALMALGRAELEESEVSDQWFVDHFRSRGSLGRGDYAGCIARWRNVFPAERVQVLLFDDLRARPHELLADVANHIGVDPGFYATIPDADLHRVVLPGPGIELRPGLAPILRELYGARIDAVAELLGRDLSAWKSSLG